MDLTIDEKMLILLYSPGTRMGLHGALQQMKEQLEEEMKAVEREIIGYLDANEKLTETGNDFTVKISTCERRTVDTKKLEEDLGSLAEYQRISQYRRLYVK